MTTITKKKGISLLLVLGILLPYLTGIFSAVDLTAKEAPPRTTEIILDSSDAKVEVTHTVLQKEIQWEIAFVKKASSEQTPRRLKWSLDVGASGLGTVRNLNRDDKEDADGWYVENDTYTSIKEESVIKFTTDLRGYDQGTHFIKVAVQIDEQTTQKIEVVSAAVAETIEGEIVPEVAPAAEIVNNDNILMDHDAGPHRVDVNHNAIKSVKPEAEAVVVQPEAGAGGQATAVDGGGVGGVEDAAESIVALNGISSFASSYDNGKTYENIEPVYTTNDEGVFPTPIFSGVTAPTVKNHAGKSTGDTTPWTLNDNFLRYSAVGSSRDEEDDFGIAKWAQEAKDGNNVVNGMHDIYMEVFGNTIDQTVATPVNLVFIADNSYSMVSDKSTRWKELAAGIKNFMEQIVALELQEMIHVGYVAFADKADSKRTVSIGNLTDNKRQETILGHLNDRDGTYTHTHSGLIGAEKLFTDNKREGRDVAILLTDGVPTLSYEITSVAEVDKSVLPDQLRALTYNANKNKGGERVTYAGLYTGGSTQIATGLRQYEAALYENNTDTGKKKMITNHFVGPLSVAESMKKSGIEMRVIGIQLAGETHTTPGYHAYSDKEIEARMRSISSPRPKIGPNDEETYYYKNVGEAKEIVTELGSILGDITNTVVKGSIDDPISSQLIFKNPTSEIKITQVDEDGIAVDSTAPNAIDPIDFPKAVYDSATHTVSVTNINLGVNQRIRVQYQTHIDTKTAGFVPNSWYPANAPAGSARGIATQEGKATFKPTATATPLDFAVPSLMALGVDLQVVKNWIDDDESGRPEQLDFTVTRSSASAGNISGVVSLLKENFVDGDQWKKTFNTIKTTSDTYPMPKYDDVGVDFVYSIVEHDIEDYTQVGKVDVSENGLIHTFTNKLDFVPIGLEILKISDDDKTPLTGAAFSIEGEFKDSSGAVVTKVLASSGNKHTLASDTGLLKGKTYTLTETATPLGHTPMEGSVEIVVDNNGNVTWNKEDVTLAENTIKKEIVNKFKPVEVQILKYTGNLADKHFLGGATFKLYDGTGKVIQTKGSALDTGLAKFTGLAPGSYVIKESAGPQGYDTRDNEYKFTIDAYGKFTGIEGAHTLGDDLVFQHKNELKDFELTVTKKDDFNNILEGASFKLENSDGYKVEIKNPEAAKFVFSGLKVGTYTLTETQAPEGYVVLAEPIKIVIDAVGKVTVNGDKKTALVTFMAGTEVNTITFDVDNKPKNPLPQTGGMGTAIFYLVGAIVIAGALVNVYLKKRKGAL